MIIVKYFDIIIDEKTLSRAVINRLNNNNNILYNIYKLYANVIHSDTNAVKAFHRK